VIDLAQKNVLHETGGPFAAGVFTNSGELIAIGTNSVTRLNLAPLHAEIVAILFAQQRLNSYSFRSSGLPPCELFTSCEPCAMCLGAVLWSGFSRVACGATKQDAEGIGFKEGPVPTEIDGYMRGQGIEIIRELLRPEAIHVLETYRKKRGPIYNA